jgi:hypothetical protein
MPYNAHAIPLCAKLASRRVSKTPCLSFGTFRSNSSLHQPLAKSSVSHSSASSEQIKGDSPIQEARLGIVFTCTAEACSHRSSHTFTKRAYERGIVIVQCPGCKNRFGFIDLVDSKSHKPYLPLPGISSRIISVGSRIARRMENSEILKISSMLAAKASKEAPWMLMV